MMKKDLSAVSAKLGNMKFMKRKQESNDRELLIAMKEQEIQESKWENKDNDNNQTKTQTKKRKFINMSEAATSDGVNTLYNDSLKITSSQNNQEEKSFTKEQLSQFKDVTHQMRMGRRSFGFNPVIEKLGKELAGESLTGSDLLDNVDLNEASLVLSNNMRAKQLQKNSKDTTDDNKAKHRQNTSTKNKKTQKSTKSETKVEEEKPIKSQKEAKLSQHSKFLAPDSSDDEEDAPIIMKQQFAGTVNKKRKFKN